MESKNVWLSKIKDLATQDVVTVQEDKKVLDHVQDLLSWKIDFIVVKDKGKVVRGVIGRDHLNDIVNERRLAAKEGRGDVDLSRLSFRDLLEGEDLKEYYIIDENSEKTPLGLGMQGLPAREILIMKDKAVKAVVDRRWFKRWQGLLRFTRFLTT